MPTQFLAQIAGIGDSVFLGSLGRGIGDVRIVSPSENARFLHSSVLGQDVAWPHDSGLGPCCHSILGESVDKDDTLQNCVSDSSDNAPGTSMKPEHSLDNRILDIWCKIDEADLPTRVRRSHG